MKSFKNRYVIAQLCKISRTSQTGRTCTDDSHFLSVRLTCLRCLITVLSCPVCNKTLQLTDSNRLSLDTADTNALTLCLLRAHSSANSRKRGGTGDDLSRFLDISFFYLMNEFINLNRYGTTYHTLRISTIQATLRLFLCFFLRISQTYFFKILRTNLRFLFSHRNSLHHISHIFPPLVAISASTMGLLRFQQFQKSFSLFRLIGLLPLHG